MATGIYLIDNPPRVRQYRSPRRAKPSGVIVKHTAEAFADEVAPDRGAENVADFIRRRTNYGSYHDLVDSDSVIRMVRYSDEAFHDATGSNPHSYGVSVACQADEWPDYEDEWVEKAVANAALACAGYAHWIKRNYGIVIPARRITRAQSEARVPGFISHAERDPARRRDPGRHYPWDMFLDKYDRFVNSEDDEEMLDLILDKINYVSAQVKAVGASVAYVSQQVKSAGGGTKELAEALADGTVNPQELSEVIDRLSGVVQ